VASTAARSPARAESSVAMRDDFASSTEGTAQSPVMMPPGTLTVERVALPYESGRDSSDLVLAPQQAGNYPVVTFHHGTALLATDYEALLAQVASHGFIIMAPQIYRPLALLTTSVQKEQEKALESQRWAVERMQAFLPDGVRLDPSRGIIVAGHSRGGGIAFLTANERSPADPALSGVILLDPVDTKSVPFPWLRKAALAQTVHSDPTAAHDAPLIDAPSLIFGTGLGSQAPACAPEGINHVQFYASTTRGIAESWHVVAGMAGHMDMLDDALGWFSSTCARACKASHLRRAEVRDWLGGMMVAFLRDAFQQGGSMHEARGTHDDAPSSHHHHLESFLRTTPEALDVTVESSTQGAAMRERIAA